MQTRCLIAGQWTGADRGSEFEVRDPATDAVVARVPNCGEGEARRAIDAAAAAFPPWRDRTASDRGRVLRALSDLMLRDQVRLAKLMTSEQGKPLTEARSEIAYAASFIEWAAEEGKRVYGETIPASAPDKRLLVLRQPVGVCCAITPWNFPSAMITRKLGPALACGCTMVIKPAEQTPLSALAIGELCVEAGIPAGVVGIVTGDAEPIARAMFTSPVVRKLSFTGSTEVGRVLMRQSADNVIRVSLELGGHAPFIVFADADLDAAVTAALANKLRNGGQTCICANRFIVERPIASRFAELLGQAMSAVKVGRGTDDGVQVGPLIDDRALAKVEAHVADAVSKGATIVTGGQRARPGPSLADRFYCPTVLAGCTRAMRIATEETFGPVAPIFTFDREDEAVRMANDTEYGLAAYFFTRDGSRIFRVVESLEYGIVGVNDASPSTPQAPFGGVKHSGFGREGGRHVMDEYTDLKFVSWRI